MLPIVGLITVTGGLFLFLWYRTLVSLPEKRRPLFVHHSLFKWGIPFVSISIFISGLYQLSAVSRRMTAGTLAATLLLIFLFLKFDRYSAEMRVIHEYYGRVRGANPGIDEIEVLFLTAQWRYPEWPHDRIVELVAGKTIGELMVLMLIQENKINPLSDWELYRSLKAKAARIVGGTKGGTI